MQTKKVALYLLIGVFVLAFSGISASKEDVADSKDFIGEKTCRGCHEGYYESYSKSIHAKKAITKSPANANQCESCHGAGAEHVEKGGVKGVGIFAFGKKVDAKDKAAKCLSCHEESKHLSAWNMSKHKSAGVSCDNCHSAHAGGEKSLKARQPELCFGCHKDIRAQANKQSHHPMREGKVSCSDCHDPHGGFGSKMVKADTVNELCYKCHSEKRGPYMWEHAPVEENCLTCHTAHGSNHNKLLTKKMPNLCQSCHDWTLHPGTPYTSFETFPGAATSGKNRFIARSCTNCHTNIHGSNGPSTRGLRFVR